MCVCLFFYFIYLFFGFVLFWLLNYYYFLSLFCVLNFHLLFKSCLKTKTIWFFFKLLYSTMSAFERETIAKWVWEKLLRWKCFPYLAQVVIYIKYLHDISLHKHLYWFLVSFDVFFFALDINYLYAFYTFKTVVRDIQCKHQTAFISTSDFFHV